MKDALKPLIERISQIESKIDLNKVNQVREKLTHEFNENLEKRFPKEKRDELKEKVISNFKETKQEVESRARELAEKSKDSSLVLNYLRPFVGSEKTYEVLANIETKVSSAGPVVRRLQLLRKQFMDLTAPTKRGSDLAADEKDSAPAKKRKTSKAKASDSDDA